MFRLHYKNNTQSPQSMSLTPVFPAKVVPVDLARYNGLTIQKMSYFATTGSDLKFTTFMPTTMGSCIGGLLSLSISFARMSACWVQMPVGSHTSHHT